MLWGLNLQTLSKIKNIKIIEFKVSLVQVGYKTVIKLQSIKIEERP